MHLGVCSDDWFNGLHLNKSGCLITGSKDLDRHLKWGIEDPKPMGVNS